MGSYPNSQRPAGGKIIAIYFALEEWQKLDELAEKRGEKRNALVRRLVREAPEPA